MQTQLTNREDFLAGTLSEMQRSEPDSVLDSDLFHCDLLDRNAGPQAMWEIIWRTN